MPPVEALSCGTKVIASDIPVHHEILENDVEYFNPRDPNELSDLIDKGAKNKEIVNSKIPSKFSWNDSSYKMYKILEEAASE